MKEELDQYIGTTCLICSIGGLGRSIMHNRYRKILESRDSDGTYELAGMLKRSSGICEKFSTRPVFSKFRFILLAMKATSSRRR